MTRRENIRAWAVVFVLLFLVLAGIAYFLLEIPSWFWHPLGNCTGMPRRLEMLCKGYNYHSGIGSNIPQLSIFTTVTALALAFWHRHNCHEKGCPRLQWHIHPDTGHPVCKVHHKHELIDGQIVERA